MRTKDKVLVERFLGVLTYLYGRDALEKIRGKDIEVVYNPILNRIKGVIIDGKLSFVVRASDGYLLPLIEGAKYVDKAVVVSDDAAEFVRRGRSVTVRSVIDMIGVEPGSEVVVKDGSGRILAVGRALLSDSEARSLKRGILVRIRKHAPSADTGAETSGEAKP